MLLNKRNFANSFRDQHKAKFTSKNKSNSQLSSNLKVVSNFYKCLKINPLLLQQKIKKKEWETVAAKYVRLLFFITSFFFHYFYEALKHFYSYFFYCFCCFYFTQFIHCNTRLFVVICLNLVRGGNGLSFYLIVFFLPNLCFSKISLILTKEVNILIFIISRAATGN